MTDLENLSINELSEQLSKEKDFERRKNILKSAFNKSVDYVENHARWGEVLDTENYDGLNIGDEVKYRSLYFNEETGYVAGFFQVKSSQGVKPAIIPKDGVEYSIPLQNSIKKID